MNPLEAAARWWMVAAPIKGAYDGDLADAIECERLAVVEWLRAAIGCPQCKGSDVIADLEGSAMDCAAEHVEIPLFGETIWADPAKCEWRCGVTQATRPREKFVEWHVGYFPCQSYHWGDDPYDCGWVPRWDALTGDNDAD